MVVEGLYRCIPVSCYTLMQSILVAASISSKDFFLHFRSAIQGRGFSKP